MSDPAEPRFLADESCDFAVVRALRAAGYDVVAVAETNRGIEDSEVIAEAVREGRILLTEDKDFGQLVFASASDSAGVVLIRFPGNARETLPGSIVRLIRQEQRNLLNAFAVIQPGHVRIRQGKR